MNKLIILGNGFDLAHGLDTRYSDFLNWYMKSVYEEVKSVAKQFDDPLLKIIASPVEKGSMSRNFAEKGDYLNWLSTTNSSKTFKSDFFVRILNKQINGWVDIENELFEYLYSAKGVLDTVEKLNVDFSYIRTKLIEYLKLQDLDTKKITPNGKIVKLFTDDVGVDEKICILNFNYTTIANIYKEACQNKLIDKYWEDTHHDGSYSRKERIVQLINIHGELGNENNPPIFGIGDEHSAKYKELKEEENLSTLLKYSKSFWYQRTNNYKKTINYIDAIDFDNKNKKGEDKSELKIEIFGHSCGKSDRTLLKYIFEHENVKMIQLHHYGGLQGYIDSSYEVWRHFDDSHKYRVRFDEYRAEDEMPKLE